MLLKSINSILNIIKEIDFASEKELQTLCENNLETLLNLEFVASEFVIANFRLDTVAYDKENNAFVIIEYKNKRNSSVIDQGYSYLSVMLNHKADFVLEYSRKTKVVHNIENINWDQSKVIFISPQFTNYQINSINFKDLPIELWKIKKYTDDTISFEQIKPINSTAAITDISPISNMKNEMKVVQEIKVYTEESHVSKANLELQEIYSELKDFILTEDDNLTIKANQGYVGYQASGKNKVLFSFQKRLIKINLKNTVGTINDYQNIFKSRPDGWSEAVIENEGNIGYIQDVLRKYLSK